MVVHFELLLRFALVRRIAADEGLQREGAACQWVGVEPRLWDVEQLAAESNECVPLEDARGDLFARPDGVARHYQEEVVLRQE